MKMPGFESLNRESTGPNESISKARDIFYQCTKCNSIVPSTPTESVYCQCGNIGIDFELNRLWVGNFSNFQV
jgi:hypothetical protein